MSVTLAYTDTEFMEWLLGRLRGRLSEFLDWTVGGGDLDDILEATLLAYEVEDIADVPATVDGVRKLRAYGLAELWTAVVEALGVEFDHSADGASFSRNQLLQNAERQLQRAEGIAMSYGWSNLHAVQVASVSTEGDPYVWTDGDGWS